MAKVVLLSTGFDSAMLAALAGIMGAAAAVPALPMPADKVFSLKRPS